MSTHDHRRRFEGSADPGDTAAPGRSTLTSRLTPRAQQIVFRVESAEAAAALADRFGARDDNGVASGADVAVDRAASSSGAPLPADVRSRFEGSMGADLSAVRVHTGGDSSDAATAVGARAYTTGQDIHFAAGQYAPTDAFGLHLLAHEVAHTVQQAGGAASGAQYKLEVSGASDPLERQADAIADRVVAGESAADLVGGSAGTRAIQRRQQDAGHHDPASIRRAILQATHQIAAARAEMLKYQQRGQGGGRILTTLTEVGLQLGPLTDAMKALGSTQKQELIPLAEALIFQVDALRIGHAMELEIEIRPMLAALTAILRSLGELHPERARAAFERHEAAPGETEGDRSAEAIDLLRAAKHEIDAAVAPDKGDLVGPAGFGRLAACRTIVESIKAPAARQKLGHQLEPHVKAVHTAAHDAGAMYDGKAPSRIRELYARVDALAGSLPGATLPRLSEDKQALDAVYDRDKRGGREYSAEQMSALHAQFHGLSQRFASQLAFLYRERHDGVDRAQRLADGEEKPSSSIWMSLAMTALSLASGGIAGVIFKHTAEKLIEKGLEELKEEIVKGIKEKVAKQLEEAMKELPKKVNEAVDAHHDKKLDKRLEKAEEEAAGGDGSDPKERYFGAQRHSLNVAQLDAEGMESVLEQALAADFATHPEEAVAALRAFTEAMSSARSAKAPSNTQTAHTSAGWLQLLAASGVDKTTAGKGGIDMSGEISSNGFEFEVINGGGHLLHQQHHVDFKHYERGELTFELAATTPPKVTGAWLKGLNEKMRAYLQDQALAPLNIPMRAVIVGVGSIARNERGEIFVKCFHGAGEEYLEAFAHESTGDKKTEGARWILETVIGGGPLPVKLNKVDDATVETNERKGSHA